MLRFIYIKIFLQQLQDYQRDIQRFLNTDLCFSGVENCMNIWKHLKHVYSVIIIHLRNENVLLQFTMHTNMMMMMMMIIMI
jgi:hypothetical protein